MVAHMSANGNPGRTAASAEKRLEELGLLFPSPPGPFGTYVEAVGTGNLLFLRGMLPTQGREPKFTGRVGAELEGGSSRDGQCARCRPAAFGNAR
jgi:hypothetical protein